VTEEFAPPAIPKADNSTGPPVPPSGLHPVVDSSATITMVGALPDSPPSEAPAPNIHK